MEVDMIHAPWSSAEVDALNRFQRAGIFHEFTCGNSHGGHDRALFATVNGWRCAHCDYTQHWAHRTMLADPAEVFGSIPSYVSPLRDLCVHIDAVAQRHPAYPQAADALRHLRDHLQALAFCEETNQREARRAPAPVYRR
jgi:hypothetical protein